MFHLPLDPHYSTLSIPLLSLDTLDAFEPKLLSSTTFGGRDSQCSLTTLSLAAPFASKTRSVLTP